MSDNFFVATNEDFEHVSNISKSSSKIQSFAELESQSTPSDNKYDNYYEDKIIFVCEIVPTGDGYDYKIIRIVRGGVIYAEV